MSGYRLNTGGRIDRAKVLTGTLDGRPFTGHPGDSLASALLASGVDIVGRSFKLSRPRGLLGAGLDEANAIFTIGDGADRRPNVKATEASMMDGIHARVPNAVPNARRDIGGALGLLDRFLPAGFYYKTFLWPDWHLFEPAIRRMAGMGRLPDALDPQGYDHAFAACDRLVVGGGPAGLSAARAAGEAGERVILVELDAELGGHALWSSGDAWLSETLGILDALDNVTVMTPPFSWLFLLGRMLYGREIEAKNRKFLKIKGPDFPGNFSLGPILYRLVWEQKETEGISEAS
ncbi:MAG: 2Fe-2S iron-sulfur cluster-binding protein [Pseudomonadota bacterium]